MFLKLWLYNFGMHPLQTYSKFENYDLTKFNLKVVRLQYAYNSCISYITAQKLSLFQEC